MLAEDNGHNYWVLLGTQLLYKARSSTNDKHGQANVITFKVFAVLTRFSVIMVKAPYLGPNLTDQ
jgi:hypothetical protein